MNSFRLKAILRAVEEGAAGPPRLPIHDAVRAEFAGYLKPKTGGGWTLTSVAVDYLRDIASPSAPPPIFFGV